MKDTIITLILLMPVPLGVIMFICCVWNDFKSSPTYVDLVRLSVGECFIFKNEPKIVFMVLFQEGRDEGNCIRAINFRTGEEEKCKKFSEVQRVKAKFKVKYKFPKNVKESNHIPIRTKS